MIPGFITQFLFYVVSNRSEEYTLETLHQDFGNWFFVVTGHHNSEAIYKANYMGDKIEFWYGSGDSSSIASNQWKVSDTVYQILAADY